MFPASMSWADLALLLLSTCKLHVSAAWVAWPYHLVKAVTADPVNCFCIALAAALDVVSLLGHFTTSRGSLPNTRCLTI